MREQMSTLKKLHDRGNFTGSLDANEQPEKDTFIWFEKENAKKSKEKALDIRCATLDNVGILPAATSNNGNANAGQRSENCNPLQNMDDAIKDYLNCRKLSRSQARIVNHVLPYFKELAKLVHGANGERGSIVHAMAELLQKRGLKAPLLLITGNPGTGKSYLIETIRELMVVIRLGTVTTCSYNGIAAVNIDGSTICSLFGIIDRKGAGPRTRISAEAILRMQEKIQADTMTVLIIDECSTIDTKIVALLHYRLQQLTGLDLPFGGYPVILNGDFNQLGPVLKRYIPADMMAWALHIQRNVRSTDRQQQRLPASRQSDRVPVRVSVKEMGAALKENMGKKQEAKRFQWKKAVIAANNMKPGSLSYEGCNLFAEMKRFHLEEQMRASEDIPHMQFVDKLSKGENISLEDILRIQDLTEQDIDRKPEEWKYAPVLVSTNIERLSINRYKAGLWAKDHGTYVFKWKTQEKVHVNRPPREELDDFREVNPFFWQFWVKGAPANLSHNINNDLAMVNGAPVIMHSLVIENPVEYERIRDIINRRDPPPFGSEIEILCPTVIYIAITASLDNRQISTKRQTQLQVLQSLRISGQEDDANNIIVPISKTAATDYDVYAYDTRSILFPIATVQVRDPFQYNLAFAMTVYKAQGRTIHRLVLDLTYHDNHYTRMEFAAIFVAMSRVKSSSHIRLLPHPEKTRLEAYQYLTYLKPSREAAAFYHGYEETNDGGMVWNQSTALAYSAI